jgi:ribosomal protein S18 acetylase RimI-like enzyme
VLEQNELAQNVYRSVGFEGYNLGKESNNALFWQKKL